jgi:uncharacterized protein (TIGR02145 family)
MKKAIIIAIISLFTGRFTATAQVSISADGSPPDSSAMLDIQSTGKGVLIPRMTKAQRAAISSPATGLMVYQIDVTPGFYFYSGSAWSMMDDPCGRYIIRYGDLNYHTVRIGSQCWLKENLNIGILSNSQTDNGIIEKFCPGGSETYCTLYGGNYQWNEMMQYGTSQGAQGICPSGWHVPTDGEWVILAMSMDSYMGSCYSCFGLGTGETGFDAGKNMKSNLDYWPTPLSNGDLMGFSALPAGSDTYGGTGEYAYFWTSTTIYGSSAWFRSLADNINTVYRNSKQKTQAFSVRCIRD